MTPPLILFFSPHITWKSSPERERIMKWRGRFPATINLRVTCLQKCANPWHVFRIFFSFSWFGWRNNPLRFGEEEGSEGRQTYLQKKSKEIEDVRKTHSRDGGEKVNKSSRRHVQKPFIKLFLFLSSPLHPFIEKREKAASSPPLIIHPKEGGFVMLAAAVASSIFILSTEDDDR